MGSLNSQAPSFDLSTVILRGIVKELVMCGLVAIFSKKENSIHNEENLKKMSCEIQHRGPDDDGYYTGGWFSLGFRRLSILDISCKGHQPMQDESKRYVLVFNGEIYNFKELKETLRLKGYTFHSNSDTEVLLKSYIEWKEQCLEKIEGMFSFLIVDTEHNTLFGARDHLGIKPLYYAEDNFNWYFASEPKAFAPVFPLELNEKVLYEQIVFGYVAGENTPLKNIYKILPGNFLKMSQKEPLLETVRYYSVNDPVVNEDKEMAWETLLENAQKRINTSVMTHTQSDVGFNVQLSGGIDSSYITAILSKECKVPLNTYSVKIDNFSGDESSYQQQVAGTCRTHHHEYVFDHTDMAKHLPEATYHMDGPVPHFADVFLFCLCKESRISSKVILTGEGADELLCGYTRYKMDVKDRIAQFLNAMNIPHKILPNVRGFIGIKSRMRKTPLDYILYSDKSEFDTFVKFPEKEVTYRLSQANKFTSLKKQILAHDQTAYLESLLDRQDKMSMGASVEARVPFCLPSLFDFFNRVPVSLKLLKNQPKAILKKLLCKYFDQDFVYRRKNGFILPVAKWLVTPEFEPFLTMLTDEKAVKRGFYRVENIKTAIRKMKNGDTTPTKYLLRLMLFEIWLRTYVEEKTFFKTNSLA